MKQFKDFLSLSGEERKSKIKNAKQHHEKMPNPQ